MHHSVNYMYIPPLLLLLLVCFGFVSCGQYFIVPMQNSACFGESCLTLAQFANISVDYTNSNTTLIIAEGDHDLDFDISASNIKSFYMLPMNDTSSAATRITCSEHHRFIFSNVGYVYFGGVTFIGCDGTQLKSVNHLMIEGSRFLGQSNHASLLRIDNCNVNIINTQFLANNVANTRSLNFNVVDGGALVVSNSTIEVDNCLFKRNGARVGGAIYSESASNVFINNSTFVSNTAIGFVNELCLGGAVFVDGTGKMIIRNSSFEDNASNLGGAVAVASPTDNNTNENMATSKIFTVETTMFARNLAHLDGGAVYVHGNSITIRDSEFLYNKANRAGGAIRSSDSSVTITSNYFDSNLAKTDGGVIDAQDNSAALVHCSVFMNNTAFRNGAVIHLENNSSVELTENSMFNKNTAIGFGGVVSATNGSFVLVNDGTAHNNIASISGGVFHITYSSNISVINSSFVCNNASTYGGVLFLTENSTSSFSNNTFSGNTARMFGGVFHVQNPGSIAAVTNGNFSHNEAKDYGGVAVARYGGKIVFSTSFFDYNSAVGGGVFDAYSFGNVEVYGSIFSSNRAMMGGVILIQINSSSIIEDSVFTNHVNVDLGAIIQALNGNNVFIQNCSFTNNLANYGGSIYSALNNTVVIINSRFYNNTAKNDGGVVYTRILGEVTINNASFVHNKAISDGIIVATDSIMVEVNHSTFRDNIAGHDGGVIYAYDRTNVSINDCTFINNRAENSGGIAYIRSNCTIAIFSSLISSSAAQSSGGGVHAQDNSHIWVDDSNFDDNTADYGGGFRVYVISTAVVSNSNFRRNEARIAGGAMAAYERSTIRICKSYFTSNIANVGGVAIAFQNVIFQDDTTKFINNLASEGVDTVRQRNIIDIESSSFENNSAANSGGVMYIQGSTITIKECSFDQNSAKYDGGNINANRQSLINISDTNFTSSEAGRYGGVLYLSDDSSTDIQSCTFDTNRVFVDGGVAHLSQSTATIFGSFFSSSFASSAGGVLTALNGSLKMDNNIFVNNTAYRGGVVYASTNSMLIVGRSQFISNIANHSGGALYVANFSDGYIIDNIFHLNRARERGGAVCTTETSKVSLCHSIFSKNMAQRGAAVSVRRMSSVVFDSISMNISLNNMGTTGANQIENNTATRSGGGIYVSEGDIHFNMEVNISHNQGNGAGGGIHATNSTITVRSNVHFTSNQADKGGGMSLQNSKLYDDELDETFTPYYVNLISNQAILGGGLYIDDESEESVCSNNPYSGEFSSVSGCFFENVTRRLLINFSENYAKHGGHDLYGGLLDRCRVVIETNSSRLEPIGTVRFKEISNITSYATVTSKPVRLCLCKNGSRPDCDERSYYIQVTNRDSFTIPVAAVDQVNHSVVATVHSSFSDVSLAESQSVQRIDATCSNLDYHVSFTTEFKTYNLVVYPEGPCSDKGSSGLIVSIYVVACSCPSGFVPADTNLECDCVCDNDEIFKTYIQNCDSSSESVIRKGLFWIKYFNDSNNDSSPYFIYPFCPFDYCQPPSVSVQVNLNIPDGSDAQCANNRGGVLCGTCKPTYSVSLGSSRCIQCHGKWHGRLEGILIASFLCGIVLVFFLLMLNLTVAVGTLNSIIFYANIINVNRSAYFGQPQLTFVSVFISWLNLDIGFDTCFFEGMDTYEKTWLQLVFPLYIILLVVVVIVVSSYSSRFSNLIGKRDPVATLATLILLSYTKLLQVVIASFSFVTLKYPNGTIATLWLPDASIEYSDGRMIALVVVAIIILILGLLYTATIFSWQWLLQLSKWKLFAWTRNQKLHTFINTYHNPYCAKHRYWTGLLLLVRVVLHLIDAFSESADPRIALLSTVILVCCLFMHKTLWLIRVHKNKLLSAMESFVLFNVTTFAVMTLYNFNGSKEFQDLQQVSAYVSVGTVVILCLVVILVHVYRYGNSNIYASVKNSKIGKRLAKCHMPNDHSQDSIVTESNLLDALDHPRSGVGRGQQYQRLHEKPTASAVSLTGYEESPDSKDNLNQLEEQCSKSNESENFTIPMHYSEESKDRSISRTRFEFTRKSEPPISLTSFIAAHDHMKKPLLEEGEHP